MNSLISIGVPFLRRQTLREPIGRLLRLTTPLREHPLLIALVFIVFLSEPYYIATFNKKRLPNNLRAFSAVAVIDLSVTIDPDPLDHKILSADS
jgi:hypothetical protein